MKIKRLGANLNVDKITIKKDVLKLVFFKSRSEKEKNNTFGLLLKLFNKEGHKYTITEKTNQIIISVLGYLNLEKTLNLLKKIKV